MDANECKGHLKQMFCLFGGSAGTTVSPLTGWILRQERFYPSRIATPMSHQLWPHTCGLNFVLNALTSSIVIEEEEEDIFVERAIYWINNFLFINIAHLRDVDGTLLQSTFTAYTQCSLL